MRAHTVREMRVWLAWLDMELDKPDRSDHYAMQVACEVRRVLARNPRGIQVGDFRLRFHAPKSTSAAQAAQWSKAKWFAAVGYTT
jgi:hypothetical protein